MMMYEVGRRYNVRPSVGHGNHLPTDCRPIGDDHSPVCLRLPRRMW